MIHRGLVRPCLSGIGRISIATAWEVGGIFAGHRAKKPEGAEHGG